MEYNIQDYEIFRKMYYTNNVRVRGDEYSLSHCPYLDIILTDHCNSKCKFCVAHLVHNKENCNINIHKEQIKYAVYNLNVREVLLLGGEPTVSKDLFPMVEFLKTLPLDKICMTTNGIRLCNEDFCNAVFASGITHLNLSLMSVNPDKQKEINGSSTNVNLKTLSRIWDCANKYNVKLRINNNVFKGNHDTIEEMIRFYKLVRYMCHSLKFSPLLKTDTFSTVDKVTEFNRTHILDDMHYEELWKGIEKAFKVPIIRNKETLGFVEYSMILADPTPIILNYNHRGNMMKKVTAERKINSIKLLTNGHLSLSWNRECPEYYIR